MLLLHLFLFLLLTSHSLSQTDVTNITTTSSSAEELDVESIDGDTMVQEIEVERINEEMEVKQEDEEHIEEEGKEDGRKELNSEVTTPESESDEISTVKEFETSRSLLSAAWKELGNAEVAADEVKRKIA